MATEGAESDGAITRAAKRVLAEERGKLGEWLSRYWPILSTLAVGIVFLVVGYVGFQSSLERASQDASAAMEILRGDPAKAPGLVDQVRQNTRELEHRRTERAASDAEVIRRLDLIQTQMTQQLERLARLETKIEGSNR